MNVKKRFNVGLKMYAIGTYGKKFANRNRIRAGRPEHVEKHIFSIFLLVVTLAK